jgi:hypothetical protein
VAIKSNQNFSSKVKLITGELVEKVSIEEMYLLMLSIANITTPSLP